MGTTAAVTAFDLKVRIHGPLHLTRYQASQMREVAAALASNFAEVAFDAAPQLMTY